MAKKKQKKTNTSKKSNIGEKIALILAGLILVPTVALTACIVLAQTTDMDFDWLANKAAAIEEHEEAEEAARIAEEEAAAAEKEKAKAEEEAAKAASSSSSMPTSVNVELIDHSISSTPASTTAEVLPEELPTENIDAEDTVSAEGGAEASVTGNLNDKMWITDDNEYYHKNSSCSGLINPREVTMQDALYAGKTPCPTCCK